MRLLRVEPFGSGLDSGKVGTVVPRGSKVHADWRRHVDSYTRNLDTVLLQGLDGDFFSMFEDRLIPVRYIYIGPNCEIGIPTLPVGYYDRWIEWWRNGKQIGSTRHLPPGTTGKTLWTKSTSWRRHWR